MVFLSWWFYKIMKINDDVLFLEDNISKTIVYHNECAVWSSGNSLKFRDRNLDLNTGPAGN